MLSIFLLLLSALLVGEAVFAGDLVLIANPASGIERLTREQAIDVYLGRNRRLPSGTMVMPIDVYSEGNERERFYSLLVNKDLPQINSYWARLVFSGKATPPLQAPDTHTALQLVATNPSAIAYVDRAVIDNRVKVVLELER